MINCIAIDDEPLAIDIIADDISKVDFLHLVKKCTSANEALEILEKEKIELIFLDIQMPGLSGIQFLKSFKNPPIVIFTTAYSKYALEGFDLDVLDYLLKPIPFDRFLKACNKAAEFIEFKKSTKEESKNNYFFIKAEYKTIKISNDDVLHVEGLKDYVKIFCEKKTTALLTRMNLKNMEEILSTNKFIRVHRSFIVNISKVSSVQKSYIIVGDKKIPVGDNYRDEFMKRYNG